MSTFSTTNATGETIDADDVNNVAKAVLAILGATNDNDGDPMAGRSLDNMLAIRGSDANLAGKHVAASTSFTVPGGQLFVITTLRIGAASTVTPSGGAAISLSNSVTGIPYPCRLILGGGDQISLGVTSDASGFLVTAPSDLTRILQEVDNSGGAMTYTVPTGKVAILTFASPNEASTDTLNVDGVGAQVVAFGGTFGTGVTNLYRDVRIPLKAAQAVTGAAATDILISGVQFNA